MYRKHQGTDKRQRRGRDRQPRRPRRPNSRPQRGPAPDAVELSSRLRQGDVTAWPIVAERIAARIEESQFRCIRNPEGWQRNAAFAELLEVIFNPSHHATETASGPSLGPVGGILSAGGTTPEGGSARDLFPD